MLSQPLADPVEDSMADRRPALALAEGPGPDPCALPERTKLSARHITFHYGKKLALDDVTLPLYLNRVTALVGPSGCGKSTLLRVFNRMHELYPQQRVQGQVLLDGEDILASHFDVNLLRARVGMVFQKPTPFPLSIYENISFGVRHYEKLSRKAMGQRVETVLRRAALWDEVKDSLSASGLSLSGGQQQRLCIARAIAVNPEVILLDEPCSALDPLSTAKIEETIDELKAEFTVAIVTHNLQQAARVSDYSGFMYLGKLVEFGPTKTLFEAPREERTANYVSGRFG